MRGVLRGSAPVSPLTFFASSQGEKNRAWEWPCGETVEELSLQREGWRAEVTVMLRDMLRARPNAVCAWGGSLFFAAAHRSTGRFWLVRRRSRTPVKTHTLGKAQRPGSGAGRGQRCATRMSIHTGGRSSMREWRERLAAKAPVAPRLCSATRFPASWIRPLDVRLSLGVPLACCRTSLCTTEPSPPHRKIFQNFNAMQFENLR